MDEPRRTIRKNKGQAAHIVKLGHLLDEEGQRAQRHPRRHCPGGIDRADAEQRVAFYARGWLLVMLLAAALEGQSLPPDQPPN